MTVMGTPGRLGASLAAASILIWSATPANAAEGDAKGALDGKVFLVERGRMGEKEDGIDLVLFEDGTFRSTSCDRFGCEGAYTAAANGDAVTFQADTESRSRGTIHWEGTVRGDDIDIRFTAADRVGWLNPRLVANEYWARSVAVTPAEGHGSAHLLDGKTFVIRTGEMGKEADHNDIIIFWDGRFVSTRCEEGGFRGKPYSATPDGDGIRFRGEVDSLDKGTMIWEGTVRGDVLEGTMRWVHERWYWTIEREYWYEGRGTK